MLAAEGRPLPTHRYATVEGKQALERVLRAYAAFDTEVNYCQGMNFLAALLLIWLPREADAFGALVLIMKDRGLRELYKTDMTMLQVSFFTLYFPLLWFNHNGIPDLVTAVLRHRSMLDMF